MIKMSDIQEFAENAEVEQLAKAISGLSLNLLSKKNVTEIEFESGYDDKLILEIKLGVRDGH